MNKNMNWMLVNTAANLRECVIKIFNDNGYTIVERGNRYVCINNDVYMYIQNFKYNKPMGEFEIVVKLKEGKEYKKIFTRKLVVTDISNLITVIKCFFNEFEKNHLINKLNDTKELKINEVLENIAKNQLEIPTLQTRNSDSLDFYDISVWRLRAALKAAYEMGYNMGKLKK